MSDAPLQRLDADGRAALAASAARRERENRPAFLIVLTTVAFVAALLYLVVSIYDLRAAQKQLDTRRSVATQTVELAGQIVQLRAKASTQGEGGSQPITQIRSRIQAIATESGVTGRVPVPSDRFDRVGGSIRRRFEFTGVTDESLPSLIQWLDRAVEEIPGLEVYSVSVKPGPTVWQMNVSFSRWEKPS